MGWLKFLWAAKFDHINTSWNPLLAASMSGRDVSTSAPRLAAHHYPSARGYHPTLSAVSAAHLITPDLFQLKSALAKTYYLSCWRHQAFARTTLGIDHIDKGGSSSVRVTVTCSLTWARGKKLFSRHSPSQTMRHEHSLRVCTDKSAILMTISKNHPGGNEHMWKL